MTCYVAAAIREVIKMLFVSKKCQKWKMKDKNLFFLLHFLTKAWLKVNSAPQD